MKKNKQPAHTPGGPGRLRSWSGPVETDFQGRLRFSYANRPGSESDVGTVPVTRDFRCQRNTGNSDRDGTRPGHHDGVCGCFFIYLFIPVYPFALTLTLAMRGSRLSASRRVSSVYDRDLSSRPSGTGPHVPVRHNWGSDAIHSESSQCPWRIGLPQ